MHVIGGLLELFSFNLLLLSLTESFHEAFKTLHVLLREVSITIKRISDKLGGKEQGRKCLILIFFEYKHKITLGGGKELAYKFLGFMELLFRKAQDQLLVTRNKEDRRFVKYIIQRINCLRPMNACGYFEIDKATLTSMLSIRYYQY